VWWRSHGRSALGSLGEGRGRNDTYFIARYIINTALGPRYFKWRVGFIRAGISRCKYGGRAGTRQPGMARRKLKHELQTIVNINLDGKCNVKTDTPGDQEHWILGPVEHISQPECSHLRPMLLHTVDTSWFPSK
jgi:hypothetical protein